MKTSRFTDSQIMAILKQNEAGANVPDFCREHDISSASVYKWRTKFGGMDASLMKRMKELEDENRRLKKCTLKNGLDDAHTQLGETAKSDVFNCIELFYNLTRRHGNNGYLSPMEFENNYFRNQAGVYKMGAYQINLL